MKNEKLKLTILNYSLALLLSCAQIATKRQKEHMTNTHFDWGKKSSPPDALRRLVTATVRIWPMRNNRQPFCSCNPTPTVSTTPSVGEKSEGKKDDYVAAGGGETEHRRRRFTIWMRRRWGVRWGRGEHGAVDGRRVSVGVVAVGRRSLGRVEAAGGGGPDLVGAHLGPFPAPATAAQHRRAAPAQELVLLLVLVRRDCRNEVPTDESDDGTGLTGWDREQTI